MFTTRGYRQAKRENKYKSRQGQIIQKKPVFTIDNNPYVLEQYRKFLFGSSSTPTPPTPKEPTFDSDTHSITLSEFILSWTSTTDLDAIFSQLTQFAVNIFAQYTTDGKYPISLELYSPGLDDTNGWKFTNEPGGSYSYFIIFPKIIIDRLGNISTTQNLDSTILYTGGSGTLNKSNMTLGYGPLSNPSSVTVYNVK